MIIYDSKNWIWFFVTLFRNFRYSYNLRKLLAFIVYATLHATAVTVLSIHYLDKSFHIDTVFFSLIGVILSLFMVFRMNTSYDRWWQGRQAWGKLVNDSRSLSLHLNSLIPSTDQNRRTFFSQYIYNFCIALSWYLRDMKDQAKYVGTNDQVKDIKEAQHPPNRVVTFLFLEVEKMYKEKLLTDFDKMQIKALLEDFIDVLGICERIKNSPIPFSHTTFIKLFMIVYLAILPFGLVSEFHYLAIPAVTVMAFAMIGIEVVSEEIENPFGLDANDLPTGLLANTIRNNINEILNTNILTTEKQPVIKEGSIIH